MTSADGSSSTSADSASAEPTHAQPSSEPTDERRALVKEMADLFRSDPARASAVVQLTDRLVALGVPYEQAHAVAMDNAEFIDCDHREEYGRVKKFDGGRLPILCGRCSKILTWERQ